MFREAKRFNVATCGRRFGKTTAGEDRLIRPALEGRPVAWFSPTYKSLLEVWRDVRDRLAPVTAGVDRQQHRIELITGGLVEFWSLDTANTLRGRKYALGVVDEAGFVPDLEYAWNAVIRPTLMDYRGGAWFLGTPKGYNYFYTLWQRGQGDDPEWKSWQMPTSANPYIDPAEIEAARLEMTESTFLQEIMASFLPDGAGVFRHVRRQSTGIPIAGPESGHTYVIGADWGQIEDYTVFSVIDATAKREVHLERFRRVEYTLAVERLRRLNDTWRPAAVIPELNSIGRPVVEQLQRAGVRVRPFTMSNASKHSAVEALAVALEREELTLLNDPAGIAEMEAFESDRTPGGLVKYGAPAGMHDDIVIARCLAWQGAGRPAFRPL
jgi:hypothetical protein